MEQVDALHVDRYWSEVLCCSIMTNLSELEFKVTDFENLLKFLTVYFLNRWMDLIDTLPAVRYYS